MTRHRDMPVKKSYNEHTSDRRKVEVVAWIRLTSTHVKKGNKKTKGKGWEFSHILEILEQKEDG